MADDSSDLIPYLEYVSNTASFEAYQRDNPNLLISTEAMPEHTSLIDFRAFAQEYPDRLFPLLEKLRPEFQELFCEYYLLRKPQSFIGTVHGQVQTRIWQALRLIEQAIGALIILGAEPSADMIRPVLASAGFEKTDFGSLTDMITLYAQTQSYVAVAAFFKTPAPNIRKVFRPVIPKLLAHDDIKVVAVGAYLRSMIHQASLTKTGFSKRYFARLRRVQNLRFEAPPINYSSVVQLGAAVLKKEPWYLLEVSAESHISQLMLAIETQGKKLVGKKSAQIFIPLNETRELKFGYIFARGTSLSVVKSLTRIRGISELSVVYNDEGTISKPVEVPDEDIQKLIREHNPSKKSEVYVGDVVQILTGPASRYCGTVIAVKKNRVVVQIDFPTGRKFVVTADISSVEPSAIKFQSLSFAGTCGDLSEPGR